MDRGDLRDMLGVWNRTRTIMMFLALIGLITEEITTEKQFTTTLPDKEGALYLFSVEVLDQEENVEDTLLSFIEVPVQAINAKLFTDQETYQAEGKIVLTLENLGPTNLSFGTDYWIEQYGHEGWYILKFENWDFNSIGLRLLPGETYDHTIRLPGLTLGLYRVVKRFSAEGTELSAILAATFQVTDG